MLNIPIKDYFRETRIFNTRLILVVIGIFVMCGLLITRLVYLQIVNHKHYQTLSQANRIDSIPIPPVRGLIMDRNGVILAKNYPVFTLEVVPDQVGNMEQLLYQLGDIVELNERDLSNFKKLLRTRPHFESLPLRTRLSEEEAAKLAVQMPHLNGVELHARLQRHYPLGGLGIHAVGYVARISEDDLLRINRSDYQGTQHIGKIGIEQSYENTLLGKVGVKRMEVNAHGRGISEVEPRIKPHAGNYIYLNIDTAMQELAQRELAGRRGAVVAMNPATGAVLTFVSTPIYDPNPFVNGIDNDSYNALLTDPDKPLINRALNGQYSPGSTIKPFLGLAALESEQFSPHKPVQCQGWFSLPGSSHRFRDWKKRGHGFVNLHSAIEESCDIYFYKLAVTLGIDYMQSYLKHFGFGKKTGIDLMLESTGLLPSRKWKQSRGEPWYQGETVVTGIGQGPILMTPLQLASAVAAIANNGIRMKPRIMGAIQNPITQQASRSKVEVVGRLQVKDKKHLPYIISSMMDVVHGRKGTGRRIGWNAPYKIAGKTGTAQVKSIGQTETYDAKTTPERLRDHALFIAFAPVETPKIAVAVVVENGGHGSSAAAPIARKLMDYYLLEATGTKPHTGNKNNAAVTQKRIAATDR